MKAITVMPGKADSTALADIPEPQITDIPDGRGVRVRVLRVGLDGTDKEIKAGEYGAVPEGADFLVQGHEGFGQVVEVGPSVVEFSPGDYVVARVRRAGMSLHDDIDTPDMTTDDIYFEHGISRVHGFLTEYYVEEPRYLIKIPPALKDVAVLLEPTSVGEKGIIQAFEIQRRLKVWQPSRAAVLGAGTIGLLATMALRNRGLQVTTFGLEEPPYLNSDLVEALDACIEGRLSETELRWAGGASACVVASSSGYPGSYKTGYPITGLDVAAQLPGVQVFHSGTSQKDGEVVTNGGRVLGVTAAGDSLEKALGRAYQAMAEIKFDGIYFRRDIGHRALKQTRG